MQQAKVTPHLWFDTQAKQAADLYTSVIDGSEVTSVRTLRDTPSGDTEIVSFTLAGQPFQAISAGPLFSFNPSVSFRIACATAAEVDSLAKSLGDGGRELMPLGSYPFSERFAWLEDRFGLSWQVMLTDPPSPRIVPCLMFTGDVCGRAEEAIGHYAEVFGDAETAEVSRYGAGAAPDREGTIQQAWFRLDGVWFSAMDSAHGHGFSFSEAVSFMVSCDSQQEIDRYWDALSAVPEAEQCGWLKDRFGLSWQIVPSAMDAMLRDGDEVAVGRVTTAFLSMKKFDLAALEAAYTGR